MSGSQLNSSIGLTALNNQQQKPDSRQQQIRPTLNQNTVIAPIPQSNQHFHQQLPSQTSTPIVSNIHINPLSNPKGM